MESLFRMPALSDVRAGLLLAEIQQIASQVVDVRSEWRFYVDLHEPLGPEEEAQLNWLLAETFEPEQFGSESFLWPDGLIAEVGPRLGLVTPWSSTVKTIMDACGLKKVKRIERVRRYHLVLQVGASLDDGCYQKIIELLHDKMTEQPYEVALETFDPGITPEVVQTIPLIEQGIAALDDFCKKWGLKFTPKMKAYIAEYFVDQLKRNPTDAELFMFGQLNSEHCRHHKFNGIWSIDGIRQPYSPMDMIRQTMLANPGNVAVAYKDNAAVLNPYWVSALISTDPRTSSPFTVVQVCRGIVLKVETHNHPTTVCPYPGAATGVAVRRDIFGTGRGAVPIAHIACYYVGNLRIPDYDLPWENAAAPYSSRFAIPLQILIEASNGASDNCNSYGCPVVIGSARTFEQVVDDEIIAYRKTVMVAGAAGYIDQRHITKVKPRAGMKLIQIGGDSRPVGVGGGSGSSGDAGAQGEALDYDSVQRAAAMVEKCNHDVLRACSEMGDQNPIEVLTDLGAGGDCVAAPELVFPAGAKVELRRIPCGDKTMIVLVYFCNEAQERVLLLIQPDKLELFKQICQRNRCQMAEIGEVTGDGRFVVTDQQASEDDPREQQVPIDVAMDWLLADLPEEEIVCTTVERKLVAPSLPLASVRQHLDSVLRLVSVGSKRFLTSKADRTVGNRSAQQQEVGPLHLPLADCAVMADGPFDQTGMVIAIGEQPIKGLVNNEAGVRMSLAEALTNAVWALVDSIRSLSFSATWQWPCGQPGEDARLYRAVEAARDCCIKLLSQIGVGKDSLSMTLKMLVDEVLRSIRAPGTVQMVAFGVCSDITRVITPDMKAPGESQLMFIDLAPGYQRLGGSALLQVNDQIGDESPDVENPVQLVSAFRAIQHLIRRDLILSGHDRSDGGLITCLLEMAFAGNCGLELDLRSDRLGSKDLVELLFNEELGLVIEHLPGHFEAIRGVLRRHGLTGCSHVLGRTVRDDSVNVRYDGSCALLEKMSELRAVWSETAYRLDERQATPQAVEEERQNTRCRKGPQYVLPFTPRLTPKRIMIRKAKPKAAILREAGTNGDRDMAEACYLAGFEPCDVHTFDVASGRDDLTQYWLLAAPGGFTFEDDLDAAKGWAGVATFNQRMAEAIRSFRRLKLGICNGFQWMTLVGLLPWSGIPTKDQPRLVLNASERFQARTVAVRILESDSVFFRGMEGSVLGIDVAHQQGRLHFPDQSIIEGVLDQHLAPLRYVDDDGQITQAYPFNPNGSPEGIAGLSSPDGLCLSVMPHMERRPLNWQWTWQPREWRNLKASPWLRVFQNARIWCDES